MTATPFLDGWTVARFGEGDESTVRLPHDAMIAEARSRTAPSGAHGAYFPGGRYVYRKRWVAPSSTERSIRLLFEGSYGDTVVRLNGVEVGRNVSPYREFIVTLDAAIAPGVENLIEVDVDNTAQPNSRWYSGSGLYRGVSLEQVASTRFARDGIGVHTVSIDRGALVRVWVEVEGEADVVADVSLTDHTGKQSTATIAVVDGRGEVELEVDNPHLWSDRTPHLYDAVVRLRSGAEVLDARAFRVGLRTLSVDSTHGLRVNGERVLLKGACIHHDNGLLGAATFRAAEYRRARILKANGFNAIRSSHNPLSRELLDACDELGLYVVDEITDTWFEKKTARDGAERFEQTWPDDVRSMIAKDRNHASVIVYSIGNEVAESASAAGVDVAQRLNAFVTELDPHRPTTLAVNLLLNSMARIGMSPDSFEDHYPGTEEKISSISSTAANVLANRVGRLMQTIAKLPIADRASRDAFATVDVAGYNYAWGRYTKDRGKYPDRVILGSESIPGDLPRIWSLVESVPGVIGDFIWTGWDYLGEAGVGTWAYGKEVGALAKPFPQLVAGCGAIDITGEPGAPALLARAVWGELAVPAIAVRPLDRAGQHVRRTAWRTSDAIQSWSWNGCDGRKAEIEVYSSDEQVELVLNGRPLGRRAVREYVARFTMPYEPGELVAIGYRDGVETGRSVLRSASIPQLRLVSDVETLTADGADLAFVRVELADDDGIVEALATDAVTLQVDGAGTLAGFGSAAPAQTGSFADATATTHYGRALAIIRASAAPGVIRVTATSETHGSAFLELSVTKGQPLANPKSTTNVAV